MNRGVNVLFNNFFEQPAPVISMDRRKGRSIELIEKRNDLIFHRYHYYRTKRYEGMPVSYMGIIQSLVEEFFLSRETIIDILTYDSSALIEINKKWPEENRKGMLSCFSKKWPHFVWE